MTDNEIDTERKVYPGPEHRRSNRQTAIHRLRNVSPHAFVDDGGKTGFAGEARALSLGLPPEQPSDDGAEELARRAAAIFVPLSGRDFERILRADRGIDVRSYDCPSNCARTETPTLP